MVAVETKNRNDIGENVYSGFFGVVDNESHIIFWKFKMADSIWRPPK